MRLFRIVLLIGLVVGMVATRDIRTRAQTVRPTWTVEQCYSLSDVTAILNKLPLYAAERAKIVISNGPREIFVWHLEVK